MPSAKDSILFKISLSHLLATVRGDFFFGHGERCGHGETVSAKTARERAGR